MKTTEQREKIICYLAVVELDGGLENHSIHPNRWWRFNDLQMAQAFANKGCRLTANEYPEGAIPFYIQTPDGIAKPNPDYLWAKYEIQFFPVQ